MISTTQLAKQLGIPLKDAFSKLANEGYLERVDEDWR